MRNSEGRDGVLYTRNFILRGMCAVYLVAFISFYHQSEGLFGNNGIYPANANFKASSSREALKPNLLLFSGWLGLDVSSLVDLLALVGTLIAFAGFVSRKFITYPVFGALWVIHFSLSDITGPFENQADLLLLEAGLICIFMAPSSSRKQSPNDRLSLMLIRWLLFRFIFTSGAVKLASRCPHWWKLDGLARHLETMPLPTPLAWWSAYIPLHLLKLTMVYVFVSELVVSWLFLAPSLALRKLAFYWHLFLQFHIIITGNYGYLNFLIVTLLFSLVNDSVFYAKKKPFLDKVIMLVALAGIMYGTHHFFGIHVQNEEFAFKLAFDEKAYSWALETSIAVCQNIVIIGVIGTFLTELVKHPNIRNAPSVLAKFGRIMKSSVFLFFALYYVAISVVPFRSIHPKTSVENSDMWAHFERAKAFKIANEYGTHLRKMRSERLEIILEHADQVEGPWTEYSFAYKPWNESLSFAGPYFPRFDFKFAEAAPSNFKDHPWVSSLVLRLLQNEPAVLNLMDIHEPLRRAPKFVRASLYKFRYSAWTDRNRNGYWQRSKLAEFLPPLSLQDPLLQSNIKAMGITSVRPQPAPKTMTNALLKSILDAIRRTASLLDGSFLTFGILSTGFAIIATKNTV